MVYLTAFMLPAPYQGLRFIQHPHNASSLGKTLLVAPPQQIQALRIDGQSTDPAYRARARQAFCADASDAAFAILEAHVFDEEPLSVYRTPSPATAERMGRLPRFVIRCTADQSFPLAGQDHCIEQIDSCFNNRTTVLTLQSGHCPMLSQPAELSRLLVHIAEQAANVSKPDSAL